jgi:hypothetical protein
MTAEGTAGGARISKDRGRFVVAWTAFGLSAIGAVLGVVYGTAEQMSGRSVFPQSPLSYATGSLVAIVYSAVGLVLCVQRPRLIVGWLFLAIGSVASIANFGWAYALLSAATGPPGPMRGVDVAWVTNLILAPGWLVSAIALVLLFPEGRAVTPRWAPLAPIAALGGAGLALCLAVAPGRLVFSYGDNTHAADGVAGDAAAGGSLIFLVALVACAVAAVWSMRLRYAAAGEVQRQQLKWFGWASALVVVTGSLDALLTGPWLHPSQFATDLAWLLFTCAAVTVPIAALIAIQRHQLYDIDRLIGRTFVYGALTAILAGLYAASVRLSEVVFKAVTGQTSDAALVVTTLVLATTFTPIKGRLERIVGQRLRPAVPAAVASSPATTTIADLDRRMEDIARRVAREVLAESRSAAADDAPIAQPADAVSASAGVEAEATAGA